jgi:cell division cycle 20-like protein 1 (cofactor of APC complex)
MAREEIETGAHVAAHAEEGIATPALISPPESKTPPTESHKRNQSVFGTSAHDRNAEGVDHSHLTKALEQLEQAGRVRERTPTASPSRKRPRIYGDRLVHNGAHLMANMQLTNLQVHPEPLGPRPPSQLQPAA